MVSNRIGLWLIVFWVTVGIIGISEPFSAASEKPEECLQSLLENTRQDLAIVKNSLKFYTKELREKDPQFESLLNRQDSEEDAYKKMVNEIIIKSGSEGKDLVKKEQDLRKQLKTLTKEKRRAEGSRYEDLTEQIGQIDNDLKQIKARKKNLMDQFMRQPKVEKEVSARKETLKNLSKAVEDRISKSSPRGAELIAEYNRLHDNMKLLGKIR